MIFTDRNPGRCPGDVESFQSIGFSCPGRGAKAKSGEAARQAYGQRGDNARKICVSSNFLSCFFKFSKSTISVSCFYPRVFTNLAKGFQIEMWNFLKGSAWANGGWLYGSARCRGKDLVVSPWRLILLIVCDSCFNLNKPQHSLTVLLERILLGLWRLLRIWPEAGGAQVKSEIW